MKIDFCCACNNEETLDKNLLLSSCVTPNTLTVKRGYTNVMQAYNEVYRESSCDIICYVHQDVFFPSCWLEGFTSAIERMERIDPDWGVLGVAGVRAGYKREWLGNIQDRGRQWGNPDYLPAYVQTLDELLLIRKNKDGLLFDEKIPSNHMYGADICLQAQGRGQKCYAIDAYCHHNSNTRRLPDNFQIAKDYMRRKWESVLPIATTCTVIDKEDKQNGER